MYLGLNVYNIGAYMTSYLILPKFIPNGVIVLHILLNAHKVTTVDIRITKIRNYIFFQSIHW